MIVGRHPVLQRGEPTPGFGVDHPRTGQHPPDIWPLFLRYYRKRVNLGLGDPSDAVHEKVSLMK